jgi:hypothetical protein
MSPSIEIEVLRALMGGELPQSILTLCMSKVRVGVTGEAGGCTVFMWYAGV